MNAREAVRIALSMIRANKLRAFFTVLGTVVGVTFLIAVITLITGMNAYMKEEFAGKILGFNTINVRRLPSVGGGPVDEAQWREWQRRPRLTHDDARFLEERVQTPGLLSYAYDEDGKVGDGRGKVVQGVNIIGASANFFNVRDLKIARGRTYTESEADRGVPVVVLGEEVAKKLFEGLPVLGKEVRIQGTPFRVIGVMEEQGSLFGMSMDRMVVAPIRSPLNGSLFRNNVAEDIYFRVPDASLMARGQSELEGLMRVRHRLRPGADNDFMLETADEALGFWDKISTFLLMALPLLVAVSLVVGAVVIMNIMLVSVSERTREIGVRKSLGARRKDILLQFLVEAGTLSGAGGVLGIASGIALAYAVSAISPIPARVSPGSILLAILLGIGVGLMAGVYPAYRASRLDPIVALRAD
ncbi:MAG TPA: ABC transporter permease [Longimicrobium sp.]|jgi:putative ABC transport system permease protein